MTSTSSWTTDQKVAIWKQLYQVCHTREQMLAEHKNTMQRLEECFRELFPSVDQYNRLREQITSSVTLLQKIKSPTQAGRGPIRDSEGFAMLQEHWWVTLVITELAFRRRNLTTKKTMQKIKLEVISSDDESDDSQDKTKKAQAQKMETGSSASSKGTSSILVDEEEETYLVATDSCLSRLLELGHWKLGKPARCLPTYVTDEALNNMGELIYHVCHAYTEYAKVSARLEDLYQTRMLCHSESETLSHLLKVYFSRYTLIKYATWMPGKSPDNSSTQTANRRFVENMDARFLDLQAPSSSKGKVDTTAESDAHSAQKDQDNGDKAVVHTKKRRKRGSATNEINSDDLDQERENGPRWLSEFYDYMHAELTEMSAILTRVAETYKSTVGRLMSSLIASNSYTHAPQTVAHTHNPQAQATSSAPPHYPWYATPPPPPPYMPYHQSTPTSSSSSHPLHGNPGFHASMPPGFHGYPYPYAPAGSIHPLQYPGQPTQPHQSGSYYPPSAHGFPFHPHAYHAYMHPFGMQTTPQPQPQPQSHSQPQTQPQSQPHQTLETTQQQKVSILTEDETSDADNMEIEGEYDHTPSLESKKGKKTMEESVKEAGKSTHKSRKTQDKIDTASQEPSKRSKRGHGANQDLDTEVSNKRQRQTTTSSVSKKQTRDKGNNDEEAVRKTTPETLQVPTSDAPKSHVTNTDMEEASNTRKKISSKHASDKASTPLSRTSGKSQTPSSSAPTPSKTGDAAARQKSSSSAVVGKPWKESYPQACQLYEANKAAGPIHKNKPLSPTPSSITSSDDEDNINGNDRDGRND